MGRFELFFLSVETCCFYLRVDWRAGLIDIFVSLLLLQKDRNLHKGSFFLSVHIVSLFLCAKLYFGPHLAALLCLWRTKLIRFWLFVNL